MPGQAGEEHCALGDQAGLSNPETMPAVKMTDSRSQMAFRAFSWSGVSRLSSFRAPRDVLGHREPGFSASKPGWLASICRFKLAIGGGNPLQQQKDLSKAGLDSA